MKCFYHNGDMDGICSGAIVRKKYPNCEMIGIDYGDIFPMGLIKRDEKVIMVDYSINLKDMLDLRRTNFIWIDHHYHAIKEAENYNFEGMQDTRFGACELTWKFFIEDFMPDAVKFVGRYDVWDHKDPKVIPFHYGIKAADPTVDSPMWDLLFHGIGVKDCINSGYGIQKYLKHDYKIYLEKAGFECGLDGYTCYAFNRYITDSLMFNEIPNAKNYEVLAGFTYFPTRGIYRYSLRSSSGEVDVGAIAKRYGGGGHQSAAGFYHEDLVFDL